MMNPQIERPEPVYQQLVSHYRKLIRDGELKEGDRLPTLREIADEHGIAYTTVGKAFRALKTEGLIRTSKQGNVVSFSETGTYTPRDRLSAARRLHKIYPPSERSDVRAAEVVSAPEEVAERLEVEAGTPVVRRERVTYHGDSPVTLSVSWMPGDLVDAVPELVSRERIPGGTVGLVAERTGRQVDADADSFRVTGRAATAEEAEALGLSEGDPVLWGENVWPEADGTVLEFGEFVIPGGLWISIGP
jgi:DNA-binding GntR family transcriptional regulator